MTTLLDLVKEPKVASITVEEYDFERQSSAVGTPKMWTTTGTIQTYDFSGKPSDSQSDQD